jgi:hypothetical protein
MGGAGAPSAPPYPPAGGAYHGAPGVYTFFPGPNISSGFEAGLRRGWSSCRHTVCTGHGMRWRRSPFTTTTIPSSRMCPLWGLRCVLGDTVFEKLDESMNDQYTPLLVYCYAIGLRYWPHVLLGRLSIPWDPRGVHGRCKCTIGTLYMGGGGKYGAPSIAWGSILSPHPLYSSRLHSLDPRPVCANKHEVGFTSLRWCLHSLLHTVPFLHSICRLTCPCSTPCCTRC